MLQILSELFLDLIFPKVCVVCGKLDSFICPKCYETIEFYSLPITLSHLEKNFLDEVSALGPYQPPLSTLIQAMKYQQLRPVSWILGKMLYFCTQYPQADIVTWVPLHRQKLRHRGFNQAQEIAQIFSQQSRIPFQPLLTRIKNSPAQASLSSREKRLNHLSHTFSLHPHFTQNSSNKTILLIDDVTTTGTTLNTCAEMLKAAGYAKVYGLVLAHEK